VLDIAPSRALRRYIKALRPKTYRTADLSMSGVDDVIEITDMACYEDNAFGAMICSHVLEHVLDDRKAMRELHRVLAPGGWAILMVPINLGLKEVCEDPTITNPGLRWKYFGQDDHVRFYSKNGFVERLAEAGFTVAQYDVEYFGESVFNRCGIAERSVLYVGSK
jgi:predicted SAM-dependent methyltransferase